MRNQRRHVAAKQVGSGEEEQRRRDPVTASHSDPRRKEEAAASETVSEREFALVTGAYFSLVTQIENQTQGKHPILVRIERAFQANPKSKDELCSYLKEERMRTEVYLQSENLNHGRHFNV